MERVSNKAEARTKRPVIAIDGPAGAGKSTVARAIARMFGLRYVSTGHFYRAVTLKVLRLGADVTSGESIAAVARSCNIAVCRDSHGETRTILDGEDVTDALSSSEVDACVSEVARVPGVRLALLDLQRSLSREGGVVMDGRDIGTVVAPDADVKIFLVATLEERIRRRVAQTRERGCEASCGAVADGLVHRDRIDSGREIAPLRPASDAVVIDTTGMTPEETIAQVASIVAKATGQLTPSRLLLRPEEERACST